LIAFPIRFWNTSPIWTGSVRSLGSCPISTSARASSIAVLRSPITVRATSRTSTSADVCFRTPVRA
jgi:hypothetical protein